MFKNVTDEIKWLQKRVDANPQSMLFARLAERYLQMEEYDRAIETCQQGLDEHPNYANAHLVLAKSYMKKNDFELADQEFRKLLSIQSNHLSAHKLYGDLMTHTGWANSAETSYEKVLEIDPLETHMKEPLSNFNFAVQRSAAPGVNIEPVNEQDIDFEQETMEDLFGNSETSEELETDNDSLFGQSRETLTADADTDFADADVQDETTEFNTDDFQFEDETVNALFNQDDEDESDLSVIEPDVQQPAEIDTDIEDTDDWASDIDDVTEEAQDMFGENEPDFGESREPDQAQLEPEQFGQEHTEPELSGPEQSGQPRVDDIFGNAADDMADETDFIQSLETGADEDTSVDSDFAMPETPVHQETGHQPPSTPATPVNFDTEPEEPQLDDVFAGSPEDQEDEWSASVEDDADFGLQGPQVANDSARDDKDKYSDILEGIFSQDMDDEDQQETETRDKLEQVISEAEETTELDESYNFDDVESQDADTNLFMGGDEPDSEQESSPEDMILNHADHATTISEDDTTTTEAEQPHIPQEYVAFEEDDSVGTVEPESLHIQDFEQNAAELDDDEEEFSDFLAGLGDPKEFNDVSEGEQEQLPDSEEYDFEDLEGPAPEFISAPEIHDDQAESPANVTEPQQIDNGDDDDDQPKEKFVTPTLGEIYAAQGQYAKAIHVFEMLLEKSPDNDFYQTKLDYLRKKLDEGE